MKLKLAPFLKSVKSSALDNFVCWKANTKAKVDRQKSSTRKNDIFNQKFFFEM